jgi:hypothetical protein
VYPLLAGNFDTFIGVPNSWTNSIERDQAFTKGVILMIIFSLLTFLLHVSVIRTIITSPGSIPEEKEWDM